MYFAYEPAEALHGRRDAGAQKGEEGWTCLSSCSGESCRLQEWPLLQATLCWALVINRIAARGPREKRSKSYSLRRKPKWLS
jgi:hypothetical protein